MSRGELRLPEKELFSIRASSNKEFTLPKNDLLDLLEKNPPNLYSALANASRSDCDFQKNASSVAKLKQSLIEKIEQMNVEEIRDLVSAAQQYL